MVWSKNKNSFFIAAILFLLSVPAFLALIHIGFFPTHDFIYVARISEMFKSLSDGQFPVRWVAGFRYGDPTFNFYAPLPYYLGSLIHIFRVGFLDAAKVLFALSFILSIFTMYLLGRELFGKWGGVLSSALYLYAPYRSVDVYVRGTLNEGWGFVFFPLIFLFLIKLSKKSSFENIVFLALSLAGLFYTHNIMTIIFVPFFGIYTIYLIWVKKFDRKFILNITMSIAIGVGLAASFLLPAFLEKKYIQTTYLTAGYFDYIGHFVAVRQWFDSPWGYGASLWGPVDDLSFQLGWVQWALIFLASSLYFVKRLYKNSKVRLFLPILLILFVFSLFLQHNKSTFIWQLLPLLAYIQFPWRLLAVSVFFAALIGTYGVTLIKNRKIQILVGVVSIIALLLINYRYFRPKEYYNDSIDEHYVGSKVLSQDDKVPKDYLPIWVKKIKIEKIALPYTLSGEATFSDYKNNSKVASFSVNAKENIVAEIPVTYFPGWEARVDGNKVQINTPTDLGLINLNIPAGNHQVSLSLHSTPTQRIGNLITILSLILVFALVLC